MHRHDGVNANEAILEGCYRARTTPALANDGCGDDRSPRLALAPVA